MAGFISDERRELRRRTQQVSEILRLHIIEEADLITIRNLTGCPRYFIRPYIEDYPIEQVREIKKLLENSKTLEQIKEIVSDPKVAQRVYSYFALVHEQEEKRKQKEIDKKNEEIRKAKEEEENKILREKEALKREREQLEYEKEQFYKKRNECNNYTSQKWEPLVNITNTDNTKYYSSKDDDDGGPRPPGASFYSHHWGTWF